MFLLLAATANVIIVSVLVSLAAAREFLDCSVAVYIGAVLVAIFAVSATVFSAVVSVVIATDFLTTRTLPNYVCKSFAGFWSLDNEEIVKSAIERPDLFVLKPQREGGSFEFEKEHANGRTMVNIYISRQPSLLQ